MNTNNVNENNPFVSVATLARQRAPYALQVTGNAHAPAVTNGQLVKIVPVEDLRDVPPAALVLLDVAGEAGLFRLNGDEDATAGKRIIERGAYRLLGFAESL